MEADNFGQTGFEEENRTHRGFGENEAQGVIKELLNTEPIIQNIDMTLRGFTIEVDENGKYFWAETAVPYVTPRLRVLIINAIRVHLNHINMYSDIHEGVIQRVCADMHEALVDLFFFNINDIATNESIMENDKLVRARFIIIMIMNQIWVGMHQAVKGKQRQMLEKIGGYSETYIKPRDEKRGFLPRWG